MSHYQSIIRPILAEYPETQAVYLFGSWGTDEQWPDSDLDLALLLPVKPAKLVAPWEWLALAAHIAEQAGVAQVDLINIRSVDTVFRRDIIRDAVNSGRFRHA